MGRDKELEVMNEVLKHLNKLDNYEKQNRVLIYVRDRLKVEAGKCESTSEFAKEMKERG